MEAAEAKAEAEHVSSAIARPAAQATISHAALMKIKGARWKAMSSEDRAPWIARAAVDKTRAEGEQAIYRESAKYKEWEACKETRAAQAKAASETEEMRDAWKEAVGCSIVATEYHEWGAIAAAGQQELAARFISFLLRGKCFPESTLRDTCPRQSRAFIDHRTPTWPHQEKCLRVSSRSRLC